MKKTLIVLAAVAGLAGLALAQTPKVDAAKAAAPRVEAAKADAAKATFASALDKASYAIGADIAGTFKRQAIEFNPEMLAKGLLEGSAGKSVLTETEIRETITALQTELRAKAQEKAKIQGEKNKQEGEAFLAANATKDGVTTLPSGLQYKVIKMGDGPKPTATDKVECHYKGTLLDGTEFDSSYSRNAPATFPVNGVIKGWTEALQIMPVGSKWQLFVPAALAYGENGGGPKIGPNSTLIFEVELLAIK